jgi:hypothetical protein
MIVDPPSLETAANAMKYTSAEKGMLDSMGSGSQYMGLWDRPSDDTLKDGFLDPGDATYRHTATEPLSLAFSAAMKTAEDLYYEVTSTRYDTASALLEIIGNVRTAEDETELDIFKVFRDPK